MKIKNVSFIKNGIILEIGITEHVPVGWKIMSITLNDGSIITW